MTTDYPDIDVIVATRDRHELLLASLAAINGQAYPGKIRTTVVYDNSPPRTELERHDPLRPVRVVRNSRTPGLPGSRNTGLLLAEAPLVAFCDDDDLWLADKARRQVDLMVREDAVGCVSGIRIRYGSDAIDRVPEVAVVDSHAILSSRVTGAHPSSYIFSRGPLLAKVGLVDEDIPFGYGEDYDLLIRVAEVGKVAVLRDAAVEVLWHKGGSYFSRRWEAMDAGIGFLIAKHPGLVASRRTAAWLHGQRAFAQAASGNRRRALATAWKSIGCDPRQPRAYLAIAVSAGLLRPRWVVDQLNARGRGM